MTFDKVTGDVAEHQSERADLHELKEAVEALRAHSPDSVLAQFVEEKIARLQHEIDEGGRSSTP